MRYFVQVVEAGSISRAAALLHVTQPGLSKRIAELESALGAPLLRRGPGGVQPTEQGRALFIFAKRILQDIETLARELPAMSSEPVGTVAFGCSFGASDILGYDLFHAVRERLPRVKLLFESGRSRELLRRIGAGDLDAALMPAYRPLPGVSSTPLVREQVFVVGAPPVIGKLRGATVPIEALARLPLLVPGRSSFSLRELVSQLSGAPAALNIVAEVDDWKLQHRLTLEGAGCSLGSWSLVPEDVRTGKLQLKPLGTPQVTRDIQVHVSLYRPISTATEAVLALLRETVAKLIASGAWEHAELLEHGHG
jgi:LysR family nitrogen assimilation transcriptional regulator